MRNRFELPMMMSAKELQDMGFSRSLAYKILQGEILPVVSIGKRRFIRQTVLLKWLAEQEQKCPAARLLDCDRAETPDPAEDSPDDDQISFDEYEGGDTA